MRKLLLLNIDQMAGAKHPSLHERSDGFMQAAAGVCTAGPCVYWHHRSVHPHHEQLLLHADSSNNLVPASLIADSPAPPAGAHQHHSRLAPLSRSMSTLLARESAAKGDIAVPYSPAPFAHTHYAHHALLLALTRSSCTLLVRAGSRRGRVRSEPRKVL